MPMGGLLMISVDISNAAVRVDLSSWLCVLMDAFVFLVICFATRIRDLRGTLYVDFFITSVYVLAPALIPGRLPVLYNPVLICNSFGGQSQKN
eukprot:3380160-Amphidinium_carterae.1